MHGLVAGCGKHWRRRPEGAIPGLGRIASLPSSAHKAGSSAGRAADFGSAGRWFDPNPAHMKNYILGPDGEPQVCDDLMVWGEWYSKAAHSGERQVAFTELDGGWRISTVFLAMDHSFEWITGDGPPILWETMIFEPGESKGFEEYQERYTTRKAAEIGHRIAVVEAMARARASD